MSKGKTNPDEESPHSKRRKLTREQTNDARSETTSIQSSKDLQKLLAFQQDAEPQFRQRIQIFKLFLDSIAYGVESDDRSAGRELLLDYLKSQAVPEDDVNAVYLVDLTNIWHFSVNSNIENLFSSTAAALALLLKTISSLIDFRVWGNGLCRSLLQDEQLRLFDRAFSANKAKEHLISPCLRLLTEIVLFDGGKYARNLFRQRHVTLKRLEIFLTLGKDRDGDVENYKRPAIRKIALQYLYANIRLQDTAAKTSILAQGKVIRAVFESVSEDTSDLILQMLDVLKTGVAQDSALTRSTKAMVFSAWNLDRLATLYRFPDIGDRSKRQPCVSKAVHDLLLSICTTPNQGVLEVQDTVRISVGSTKADSSHGHQQIKSTRELSSNGRIIFNRNEKLKSFLQCLRPHADLLQSDLILAVFRKIPEMLSDYFIRRQTFPFDPKVTATWIGYSSFLLATVQLPLPELPTSKYSSEIGSCHYSAALDSILPQPLTQKAMIRCLNQSVKVIKFLAIRILIAAFEKFARLLETGDKLHINESAMHNSSEWATLRSQLTVKFYARVPEMGVVVAQFWTCWKEGSVLHESITRLLALYYKIIAQVALKETFNVSMVLSEVLTEENSAERVIQSDGLRLLEMEHLLAIAHHSPNMQWFNRSGTHGLSPFTRLLMLYATRRREGGEYQSLHSALNSIVEKSQMTYSQKSFDALTRSLQAFNDHTVSDIVFEFIDDCYSRLSKKPIRYYDKLSCLHAVAETGLGANDSQIDLFLVVVFEQFPFIVTNTDVQTMTHISSWLARYIELIWVTICDNNSILPNSGDGKILSLIRDELSIILDDENCKNKLAKALKQPSDNTVLDDSSIFPEHIEQGSISSLLHAVVDASSQSLSVLASSKPPEESRDHYVLISWSREDMLDAISEGSVPELFLCLCSQHTEIRKQGLDEIRAFMARLELSRYSEWQQTYVLVGEFIETARDVIPGNPLPYFVGVLAAQLFSVIANPLHAMYEKCNSFLNRGPSWPVTKLPSYWVSRILLNPPTEDDAHYQEVEWLLDTLMDGLRSNADFEIYRRCGIFERLLALSSSPSVPESISRKVVTILLRCTYVGGSTTLITRFGLKNWIESCIKTSKSKDIPEDELVSLATRADETSDEDYIRSWSDEALKVVVDTLTVNEKD